MNRYWLLIITILLSCSQGKELESKEEALSHAHDLIEMLNQRSVEALTPHFSETDFSFNQLNSFCHQLDVQIGSEVKVTNERILRVCDKPAYYKYTRHSDFEKATKPIVTILGFGEDGKILEFSVESQPEEYASEFSSYMTKTELALPFFGEWFVVWGGRNSSLNNHAGSRDQRFAYDFTFLKDQTFRKGEGKINQDYFSYNQSVLAPGKGVVCVVVNDEQENKPGNMTNTAGNYVVIDHLNGEYSFLCHLMKGSVVVAKGQTVSQGEEVGKCGNSGHSTAPGLHYHLQNTSELFDGEGLPAQFNDYSVDSEVVKKGEPQWGQNVKNIE